MTTYNTQNPLGSSDPRDLYDNAENLDNLVNGDQAAYDDRLGKPRKSWKSIEDEFAAFIAASGYEFVGDYAAGVEITGYQQVVRDSNGEFWRVSGSTELPYTTTGAGLPEGGAFVAVGDAALRQELALPVSGGNGATLVNGATIYAESVAELESLSLAEGVNVYLTQDGRAGEFVVKTGAPPSDPQKAIYIVLANGNYAERVGISEIHPEWFGAVSGSSDSSLELQECFNMATYLNLPVNGRGRSYSFSDANGAIPTSAGSFRTDFGLYVQDSFHLKNIRLNMLEGVQFYTSALNLYCGPGTFVILDNVELQGNGLTQSPTGPGPYGREDGGQHGIRCYGSGNDGAFGSLVVKDVFVDNFYSDGVVIRNIDFDNLSFINFRVERAGRNGITCNSKSLFKGVNCKINNNGVRTAPKSGFHFEPDSGDTGLYLGIQLSNLECMGNAEGGVVIDARIVGSRIDSVLLSGAVVKDNFGVGDIGFPLRGDGGINSVQITSSTVGAIRFTDTTSGVPAARAIDSVSISASTILNTVRIQGDSDVGIGSFTMDVDSVGIDGSYIPVEIVGAGAGPDNIDIRITTLYCGTNKPFRIDATIPSKLVRLSIGKIEGLGTLQYATLGKAESVIIENTGFGLNALDCRNSVINDLYLIGCRFDRRNNATYFVRAELAEIVRLHNCYLVNRTSAGGVPTGPINALGSALTVLRGNIIEDSAGAVSLLPETPLTT